MPDTLVWRVGLYPRQLIPTKEGTRVRHTWHLASTRPRAFQYRDHPFQQVIVVHDVPLTDGSSVVKFNQEVLRPVSR